MLKDQTSKVLTPPSLTSPRSCVAGRGKAACQHAARSLSSTVFVEERAGEGGASKRPWLFDQTPNLRRHVAMILCLPHYSDASCSMMQRVPDAQQHAFTIVPPLMVPESQLLNVLLRQKLFALFIMFTTSWHAVL